ncbi:MAG: 2-dehydropantoate 2-reductase N-terminal domain-containing protein, partial [Candidatus Binatia bacterium]
MGVKVAVVGSGSWGTALGSLLSRNGHDVTMWSRGLEVADLITKRHENRVYLPGIELPAQLKATTDMGEAVTGAELVVAVVPSHAMRETMEKVGPHLGGDALVVSASKGIEDGTHKTMFNVILDC